MTVGWGIIGIGALSDASIAPAIAKDPDAELVAVCSRSAQRAAAFAGRHGGTPYDDYDALLADGTVDVVYIATPNALHMQQTVAALRAGKHVLVDKPMALSVEDGRAMAAAADEAGVVLGVGFQLRHKATNIAGREAIAAGRIGRPVLFELSIGAGKDHFPYDTWRADVGLAGGGTLLNQGTHVLDLLQFLSSSAISDVACLVDDQALDDIAVASCRLTSGALATLASSQVLGGTPRTWRAVGEAGWIEGVGGIGGAAGDELVLHTDGGSQVLQRTDTGAYYDEVAAFTAAAAGRAPVNGTAADGISIIAAVDALYSAAAQRRTVAVGHP